MSEMSGFIEQGLEAARKALFSVRGDANLHLEPKTVTKSLRAKVRGRLKAIEVIVRRLILLMALGLDLPARALGQKRDCLGAVSGQSALPDGVEDVTQSFRALAPPEYRLRLIGARTPYMEDWREAFAGQGAARLVPGGPVSAAPLLAHIIALHRVLKKPEAAAKRVARQLQKLKQGGEPRPICPPAQGAFRLGAELGLVATSLPGFVTRALADWPEPANTS
ncbi:hypothetical protein [Hyphomonas pacifica]|uniref:Uncharacterized protein n=1 Tax=Hyphomonas pacifica TaxID=1280941 RepID=A0A062TYD5_9PROT|nr:hypothetical protein [Hyphomonas pacifica]KCZ53066.1 hypothetical protein HY2_00645 [Hyphomonas pacifica]RAN36075.1 hypothetical protein HY3_00425 [Hyphomonas pacifica]